MGDVSCHGGPGVDCAVATRPMEGQEISGDSFACKPFEGGTFLSVIDGLGHGTKAAAASKVAKETMERHPSEPLIDLVRRCDSEMRHTRGAVASLARFDTSRGTLSWIGVGNVEGVLFRRGEDGTVRKEGLALRGGVIGYMLPPLKTWTFEVRAGDLLVLATDGIAGAFMDNIDYQAEPREIVETLMRDYGKSGDDALVVAARYLGGGEVDA